MSPYEALTRTGGLARTSQLYTLGCTATTIRTAERGGQIQRLRKGLWCIDRSAEIAVAANHGGSLACLSALQAHGIWLLQPPSSIHVHVGAGGRVHDHPRCECFTHYERHPRRLGAVHVREALVQSRSCQSREAFFAAYESAWHRGLLSYSDRKWIRERLPASWRYLLNLARGDAESGLESILRLRLHEAGLILQRQVQISGVGRVDFLIDNIILEVDGRLGHADPASRHKDLRRDAVAASLGYRVLRFDYALVIHNWPMVLAAVLGAISHH